MILHGYYLQYPKSVCYYISIKNALRKDSQIIVKLKVEFQLLLIWIVFTPKNALPLPRGLRINSWYMFQLSSKQVLLCFRKILPEN